MDFKDTDMREIISLMVGRDIKEKYPRIECNVRKKIFEVKNLNAGRMVRNINLELYEGEIVGIAGLMGAGRTETSRAIFGADPKDSGEIWLHGRKVTINSPADAIREGIVVVPEDRKKYGLCTKLSIKNNISLPNLNRLIMFLGYINKKQENIMAQTAVDSLKIKLASADANADSLSGGNQQKVVVGKWLANNSKIIIFDEPTRGIDVAAKVEIYNIMNQLKRQGIGVLFISSELPEILGISDRIIVMCDGRITGEMSASEATQDKILELATRFETKLA
jgi:ribose transport system ATP-binding protein